MVIFLYGFASLVSFTVGLLLSAFEMMFWPLHHRKKELRFLGEHTHLSLFDEINYGFAFLSLVLLILHFFLEPALDAFLPLYVILPLFIVMMLLHFNKRWAKYLLRKAQQKNAQDYFLTGLARIILAVLLFIPLLVLVMST